MEGNVKQMRGTRIDTHKSSIVWSIPNAFTTLCKWAMFLFLASMYVKVFGARPKPSFMCYSNCNSSFVRHAFNFYKERGFESFKMEICMSSWSWIQSEINLHQPRKWWLVQIWIKLAHEWSHGRHFHMTHSRFFLTI